MKKYKVNINNCPCEVSAKNKVEAVKKFKQWMPNEVITSKDVYLVKG